jgi:CHAD domain-containing protein
MSFRLQSTESIADGLRRLAREELRSISKHLNGAAPPRDDALHEIRKSVKKTRAILQVVDADNGRGVGKSAKRLHAINRRLSALRDADVMLETLNTLRSKDRRILNERCFSRVRRRLSSHKKSMRRAACRKGTWRRVGQSVRKIRRDAMHWKPAHRQFGSLSAGIRLSHRRGRKAMSRARKSQRAADFHEWRKQIKALWYELRLVEGSSPRIRRDVKALHRAEEWLGNEHNLVVLCDELSKDVPEGESRIDLDRVRLAGDRFQYELRTKALASTKRIYARASSEYANAIRREWKRWTRRPSRPGDPQRPQLFQGPQGQSQ